VEKDSALKLMGGVGKSDSVWVHLTLIAEIEFRAWTADGKLRHAAYESLRRSQDNADVFNLAKTLSTGAFLD
jgi:ATP-dependent DNA ligase